MRLDARQEHRRESCGAQLEQLLAAGRAHYRAGPHPQLGQHLVYGVASRAAKSEFGAAGKRGHPPMCEERTRTVPCARPGAAAYDHRADGAPCLSLARLEATTWRRCLLPLLGLLSHTHGSRCARVSTRSLKGE